MIDTINSKPDHYTKGSFSIGTGPEIILVEGSCRVVPYVNYLDYLNRNNRFTIHLINVVNFYYDIHDNQVDTNARTTWLENNPQLLTLIRNTKWFIHEHVANFGIVNTDTTQAKHIYQFGMKPEVDISLPNFNDIFILFQELMWFDEALRNRAREDMKSGRLSDGLKATIKARGLSQISRFLEFCRKSSLPEMADLFERTWTVTRYFWSGSHISNAFTIPVFRFMNDRFFHLDAPAPFWERIATEDQYASPASPITIYDIEAYGLKWPQPIELLKL